MEESLSMGRQAFADGIQMVVATPHTMNGVYDNPFQAVNNQVAHLQEIFLKDGLALDLCPGLEVHIREGMVKRVLSGEAATINDNGRYILVEFPAQAIPSGYKEELFQLKLKGITPIIAHPERNPVFQYRLETFYELAAMGCLFQITAMSIIGELGGEAMECSHRLLDLRLAHVIATDAHSPDSRSPILSHAVEAAAQIMGSTKEAKAMVTTRPEAILEGKPLDPPEPRRPRKRRWWFRWLG